MFDANAHRRAPLISRLIGSRVLRVVPPARLHPSGEACAGRMKYSLTPCLSSRSVPSMLVSWDGPPASQVLPACQAPAESFAEHPLHDSAGFAAAWPASHRPCPSLALPLSYLSPTGAALTCCRAHSQISLADSGRSNSGCHSAPSRFSWTASWKAPTTSTSIISKLLP